MPALQHALDNPLLTRHPVLDAVDMPYAFDVVLEDGFYLAVLVFQPTVRARLKDLLQWTVRRREAMQSGDD